MAINEKDFVVGAKLVARHKGVDYKATVKDIVDGKPTIRVAGIEGDFSSLSTAGKAVMKGIACNGWRFWSTEGNEPRRNTVGGKPKAKAAAKPKAVAKPKAAAKGKSKKSKSKKAKPKVDASGVAI